MRRSSFISIKNPVPSLPWAWPVSVLKEEKIFEKIISIKYDVPNDRLDMFDDYKKQIDDFYNSVIERNA